MVISLWVTDYCNMNCSYCYVNKEQSGEMSEEMISEILNFIIYQLEKQNSDTLSIKFFGGEPLLKFEFIRSFTEKLKDTVKISNPIGLLLTTNGTLLNEEMIDFFAENKFHISLSVDGLPSVYNMHRRLKGSQNAWDAVEKHIDYTLKKLPNTFARMTYTPETVQYLHEGIEYLIKKGFTKIKPIPDYFHSGWTDENFKILHDQAHKIFEDYVCKYRNQGIEIMFLKEKVIKKKYTSCTGGKTLFSITSNGEIYPCTYVVKNPSFLLGNIGSPDAVITPENLNNGCERSMCRGCKYFECCDSARCIYLNYKMTGKMDEPNGFLCAQQRLLFDIGDRLKAF